MSRSHPNNYVYAGGNPVSSRDPSGLCLEDLCIVEGIALVEGIQELAAIYEGTEAVEVVTTTSEVAQTGDAADTIAGLSRLLDLVRKYPIRKATKKLLQCDADGGFPQANTDFENATNGLSQKTHPGGIRSAELSDGTTVSVRPNSTGGEPTIQIDPADGSLVVKIRYKQ